MAIIVAMSTLSSELSAEAKACQLGFELFCNHVVIISVWHLRAFLGWLCSIISSVSWESLSAKPRWNHFAARVEMLSKIVLRESLSKGLEAIWINIIHSQEVTSSFSGPGYTCPLLVSYISYIWAIINDIWSCKHLPNGVSSTFSYRKFCGWSRFNLPGRTKMKKDLTCVDMPPHATHAATSP